MSTNVRTGRRNGHRRAKWKERKKKLLLVLLVTLHHCGSAPSEDAAALERQLSQRSSLVLVCERQFAAEVELKVIAGNTRSK